MSTSHPTLAPTLSSSDGQILMNFFTVITLYPAATMVYEYYMNDAGDEKVCCKSTCHCLKSEKGYTRASGTEATLMNYIICLGCVHQRGPNVCRCESVEGTQAVLAR